MAATVSTVETFSAKNVSTSKSSGTIVAYTEEELIAFKENLTAANTKRSTASSLRRFQLWHQDKYGIEVNMDEIGRKDAPNLLKYFFVEIRQTTKGNEGKEYEPGTLQTYRNGLRRYFLERKVPPAVDNFDIEHSEADFQEISTVLSMKKKDLKQKGLGDKPNAAHPLEENEISQMWSSGAIGLSNPRSLLHLVWWNNMVHLGMRGVKEHHDCEISDFIVTDQYIEYHERQTKNRQGDEVSRKKARKYNNKIWKTDGGDKDPYRAFIEYKGHRPKGENVSKKLYLTPVVSPKSDTWYKISPVGVSTLSKVMKSISSAAGFDNHKKFTNSSGRKTAIQVLRDDFNPLEISELTGHANADSISSYSHNPLDLQREMSNKLAGYSGAAASTSRPQVEIQTTALSPPSSTTPRPTTDGLLNGAVNGLLSNVTFNISINLQAHVGH